MNTILVSLMRHGDVDYAVACDGKCDKAFGVLNRPHVHLSNCRDDYEWLADDELPEAPAEIGSTRFEQTKPTTDSQKHNLWCLFECERKVTACEGMMATADDWGVRVRNLTEEQRQYIHQSAQEDME